MLEFPARRPLVSAFAAGLFMGFAAPALLLTSMLNRPLPTVSEALAQDWETIGRDFYRAIKTRFGATSKAV